MCTSSIVVNAVRIAFLTVLLTLTPLELAPDGRTLAENRAACVSGSCVPEASAVCAGDGMILYDYYSDSDGTEDPE